MSTKEKIIREAMILFKQYGFKSVSMNMIADELRISKRTIYMEFENKEEIIQACGQLEISRAEQGFDQYETEGKNALEILLRITVYLTQYRASCSPAFFRDITRYSETQGDLRQFKERMEKRLTSLFMRGAKEGLIRPEAEYEVIAQAFGSQFEQIKAEYQPGMSLTFLRGICTDDGVREIERLTENMNIPVRFNYL